MKVKDPVHERQAHTWLAAAPTSSGGASSSESDAAVCTACSCAGSSRVFFRRVLTIAIADAVMQLLSRSLPVAGGQAPCNSTANDWLGS